MPSVSGFDQKDILLKEQAQLEQPEGRKAVQ